jgi:two-component system chemotaxis sensor kinase CheA
VTSESGGLDQFRLAFREEARELLVELESNLLEMNERPEDGELVGNVFRALHTIKGSGAMFGFEDLATFTHNLENAFDEVRKGRLAVTPELVDLTLSALDQIRAMAEADDGETAADPAACTEILARLRALMGKGEDAAGSIRHTAPAAKPVQGAANELGAAIEPRVQPGSGPEQAWKIRFAPGPDLMRNGADPLLLVRELRGIGRLTVEASTAGIPSLWELEPERCYVSWEMVLAIPAGGDRGQDAARAAGEDAIRDVFIFVEDSCELTIEPARVEPLADAALANTGAKEPVSTAVCTADVTARALEEKRRSPGRRATDQPDSASSLRVPAARLDQLVDLVGELVTVQARLSEFAAQSQENEVLAVAEEIERLTSALRENSMTLRNAADSGHLRTLPAAGARSGARSRQERRTDHRRRGDRARQDGDRPAGRSADAFDPEQHGSRRRAAGEPRGRRETADGEDSPFGPAFRGERAHRGLRRRGRHRHGGGARARHRAGPRGSGRSAD